MLDTKEEQQYKELRKLGQKLHIPLAEVFWTLEAFDKNGRLVQRHRQRSHSWTRNAYNSLFSHLTLKDIDDTTFEAGKLSLKDTSGTIRKGNYPASHRGDISGDSPNADYDILTPADNDTKGIQVGSGTNAESFDDYVLQTKITQGTGAGQLSYITSENHSITYGDTTLKDEQVRYFNNNSGGDVNVNEVGLVDGIVVGSSVNHYECMLARDKLASTVTVPDSGQLKVTYTIQLTYPA